MTYQDQVFFFFFLLFTKMKKCLKTGKLKQKKTYTQKVFFLFFFKYNAETQSRNKDYNFFV